MKQNGRKKEKQKAGETTRTTYAKFKCFWIRFHIFALYDISIFHLCNFIIRAIVFAARFPYHQWKWQLEHLKMQLTSTYTQRETHTHTRARSRLHSFCWIDNQVQFGFFRNSQLYLHAFFSTQFFRAISK